MRRRILLGCKPIRPIHITLALILLVAGAQSAARAQDEEPLRVIYETSFEEGLAPFSRISGSPTITTEEARTGEHSLRIERSGSVVLPQVEYGPRRRFQLEFWMKTVDVEVGANPWNMAGGLVRVHGPFSGRLRHSEVGRTQGTTEWTRHVRTISYDLKEIPDSFEVVLQMWDAASGVAYFDDVRLVELPPMEYDPRFPHRDEIAGHPPRVWPMPPVVDGPDVVDSGVVQVRFGPSGLPAEMGLLDGGGLAAGAISLTATVGGHRLNSEALEPAVNGYDALRGWMNRRRAVLPAEGGDAESLPSIEVFTEQFKSSPIVAVFVRLWLPNETPVEGATLQMALPDDLTQVLWFEGNAPRRTSLEAMHTALDEQTTKPILAAHTDSDDRGVVIYHPLRPELRRWHVDDYVPELLPVEVTAADGLTWRFADAVTGGSVFCHSLDLTLLIHPYSGSLEAGLEPFAVFNARLLEDAPPFGDEMPDGYWTWPVPYSHRGLRVVRYHPYETFATADASQEIFTYGHTGGFAWGWVSIPQKAMRFSPVSDNPWWSDSSLRMLAFHIMRRDESGWPPSLSMYKAWAHNLEDLDDFFRRHFCQDIEYRVGEWRTLLAEAEYLTDRERRDIYEELQQMRAIFDPASPEKVTWTSILPDGGYWYAYMNIPRMDMVDGPGYVLNTHMTSVGNVGELMLISREMDEQEDFGVWRELFERGVDGLLWALGDDRAWTEHDLNVLEYGLITGGPRGYHVYTVSDWLPRVMRIAKEIDGYRLDELIAYHERTMRAEFMAREYPRELEMGRRALEQIREGL